MNKKKQLRNEYFDALMDYYSEKFNMNINYVDLHNALETIRKTGNYNRPRNAKYKTNKGGILREHLYILKEIETNTQMLTSILKGNKKPKRNPLQGLKTF